MVNDDLMTVKQASRIYGRSRVTLHTAIRQGKIPVIARYGSATIVRGVDVFAFVQTSPPRGGRKKKSEKLSPLS